MLRRLGTILVCFAMFFIAGGHWAVLQSVAWAGMVRDYSQRDGLAAAVQKTFSGQYPCGMCKRIAEEKSKEQQAPLAKPDSKFDKLVAQDRSATLFPPACHWLLPVPRLLPPQALACEPPQPVPRAA
jgi:hypothetical protein